MNVTLMSSCPHIGREFEGLAPHFGKDGPAHRTWRKCVEADDPIDLSSEVRERIAGSSLVIVGINLSHHISTMRTLLTASRSHRCVVVMTLEGYRGFVDFLLSQSETNRDFFTFRVCAAILIGDYEEAFAVIPSLLPRARRHHVGGMQWADTTRAKVASFIRESAA